MKVIFNFSVLVILASFTSQNVIKEVESEIKSANAACSIDISRDSGSPQPLYIRPGTSDFFHPTNRHGQIEMNLNERMDMWCREFTNPSGQSGTITIECAGGTFFRFNGNVFDFKDITCRSSPSAVAVVRENERCFNNSLVVDVGFQTENRFLRVFGSCHNPILEANHYTSYKLTPASIATQQTSSLSWRQDQFFPGKRVDTLMTINSQRQTVATILNSQQSADNFIQTTSSQIYLARGHLAARANFILRPEQSATYTFLNFAPQYQSFNALNWGAVETGTRNIASDRNITLDTYTGTHGVTEFWNEKNEFHKIYIDGPSLQIPVPMVFYKIIVNAADQSGIVFIGVNNIFLTLEQIQRDYIFCTDIGDQVTYVNWRKTDLFRGYMYACEVNEFLRRIPHVQGLRVTSVLL